MNTIKLLGFSGSLRKGSFNTALLHAVKERLPEGVTLEIAEIGNLPLFNQDDEKEAYSPIAAALKVKIQNADGVIISTPEYNRSVPGALKNMMDWTSRPYGENAWKGKPLYVIGASTGTLGAAFAQADIKRTMLYLEALVLGQPEFYATFARDKFDATGKLTDEKTMEFIPKALDAFIAFINRNR